MFMVARLSRLSLRWPRGRSLGLASLIAIVGILDQVPLRSRSDEIARFRASFQDDREFVRRMESEAPEGSMIFQIPIMGFPETNPIEGVEVYELIRPYLHSTHLRFSHGFNRGRQQEHWQEVIETASTREMVNTLEALGFGAILLHRNGYSDHGETLLKFLAELGRSKTIEDSVGHRICVFLNPWPNPIELDPAAFVRIVPDEELVRWDPHANASRFWARGDATLRFVAVP